MKLESGKYCLTMLLEKYVKAAVKNVEEDLARSGNILPSEFIMPLSINYEYCLEDSPELVLGGVQRYQELIDHLRWAVYIGRLDIMLYMSLLLS